MEGRHQSEATTITQAGGAVVGVGVQTPGLFRGWMPQALAGHTASELAKCR